MRDICRATRSENVEVFEREAGRIDLMARVAGWQRPVLVELLADRRRSTRVRLDCESMAAAAAQVSQVSAPSSRRHEPPARSSVPFRHLQHARLCQQPATHRIGRQVDTPDLRPPHTRNSIMIGQSLIDHDKVRRDQVNPGRFLRSNSPKKRSVFLPQFAAD
jgi:hypothetical protein